VEGHPQSLQWLEAVPVLVLVLVLMLVLVLTARLLTQVGLAASASLLV